MRFKEYLFKYPTIASLISFILFYFVIVYFLHISPMLGLIICLSIAVHEYSHVAAMKIVKIPVKAVLFIPLLGAVAIGSAEKAWTRKQECFIALAGPLMGYLTILPVYLLYKITGDQVFFYSMIPIAVINLFNLLPVSPLDGGRVIKSVLMSIKPSSKIIGFVIWVLLASASVAVVVVLKAYIIAIAIGYFGYKEIKDEWLIYKTFEKTNNILLTKPLSVGYQISYLFSWLVLVSWPFLVYFFA